MEDNSLSGALVFIVGGLAGYISLHLSPALWRDESGKLGARAFKEAYPHNVAVYYLYRFLPYIWFLFYALVVFPGVGRLLPGINARLFFITYLMLGGFGFLEGIVEIATSVSAVHSGRGLIPSHLIYNKSVPRLGWLRLIFLSNVGLFAWLFIQWLL
jgi:hypothetical protein